MVFQGRKGGRMLESTPADDDFAEIRALNRLFVDFLAARARRGDPCLGLSRAVASALRAAEPGSLEALATFPRALFQVHVPHGRAARIADMQIARCCPLRDSSDDSAQRVDFESPQSLFGQTVARSRGPRRARPAHARSSRHPCVLRYRRNCGLRLHSIHLALA
jgi:hypothetical protein